MKKYKNPIIECGKDGTADPYVLKYNNMYYFCYRKCDGIYITESEELCDIGIGREVKVFEDTDETKNWYAPELHRIGGAWYIYGAPEINTEGLHVMCVLENKSEIPMGRFEYKGKVSGIGDGWSIDGTVFEHEGENMFIWTDCGTLYMSKMNSPISVSGKILKFPGAQYEFEKRAHLVQEGPAVLKKGNKIHIIYSANDSKSDEYCLGRFTYCGGDILDGDSWKKSKNAVFEKTDKIFGPGHCSFTTVTENDKEYDYMVYHANLKSGSGWQGRGVWLQKVEWDKNDTPIFGRPNFGTEI